MGFYRKKINGIEALERERKALLKEKDALEGEPFFSFEDILGGVKKGAGVAAEDGEEDDGGGISLLGSLAGMLPGVAGPLMNVVMGLVGSKLGSSGVGAVIGKKGKNIALKLAKEVVGGYLKWKAIELGYKGAKHLVKKRKEKKAGQ